MKNQVLADMSLTFLWISVFIDFQCFFSQYLISPSVGLCYKLLSEGWLNKVQMHRWYFFHHSECLKSNQTVMNSFFSADQIDQRAIQSNYLLRWIDLIDLLLSYTSISKNVTCYIFFITPITQHSCNDEKVRKFCLTYSRLEMLENIAVVSNSKGKLKQTV